MIEMIDLYFRKCRVRKEKTTGLFQTKAYKIGISKNSQNRDTKSEFLKLFNADTSKDKYDAEIETSLEIKGPESFIKAIENFIIHEYFIDEDRFFGTAKEYMHALEDAYEKYKQLVEIFKLKESMILDLNSAYIEITEKQEKTKIYLEKEYSKLKDDIKKTLSKNILKNIDSEKPIIDNKNINMPKIDICDVLVKDFILLKSEKNDKLMLMHKIYHAGKNPMSIGGSFSAGISAEKFQWAQSPFANNSGYKQKQIGVKKVNELFGKNILDLDDPNFDKSKLPL